MSNSDGSIVIDTRIDTKGFQQGTVNMQAQFSKLASSAKKLGLAMAGAFGVRSLVQFGKEAIELGSDLKEVQNVVDVTFGSLNGTIDKFSKNAIKQFGLSELSAKQYASTMGAMLKSMGLTTDQAAAMSMQIAGLSGDMASFYNLSGNDAFAKLRAGISGETEPLKQLGINLSVANLEQYALAQGITKTYDAMTEQEKVLLRYNYLLSVTSDAQGDFARTSNSWANQTKILSEQFNSLKATIGQGLINVLTPVLTVINTILSGLQAVANAFRQFTALLFGDAGGAAQQAQGIASGFQDAAGGAKKLAKETGKAAKEAKKFLAGFDEITKISEKSGSGGGGGAGGIGGVDFGGIDLGGGEAVEDNISPQIQGIVDKCLQLIAPLREIDFTPLRESLILLGGAFGELGAIIGDSLEWAWFNILVPLAEWHIEEGTPKGIGLLGEAFKLLNTFLKPVSDGMQKLWKHLTPVFGFIGDTAIKVMEWLRELFQKLAKVFEEKGPKISGIIENIGEVFAMIWEVIEPILNYLVDLVGWCFDSVGDVIAHTLSGAIDILHGFTEFLAGVFSDDISRAWDGIDEIFRGALALIENLLKDLFNFFGLEFDFDKIKAGFKGMVNSVIGFLNKLIDGLCAGINTAIKAINKLKITVPDWVPGIGGKKFGFDLKTITAPKIPYLAKGAVIPPNAPFLAMLGDQKHGTNIEAPLATIEAAVERVMSRYSGMADERIVVLLSQLLEAVLNIEIDGEVISKAIDNYRRKEAVSRG